MQPLGERAGVVALVVLHLEVSHTPRRVCFRRCAEGEEILFSGDTLFAGSVGRADLWGGDHDLLVKSIRGRLFTLPVQAVAITGHDRPTTVARERRGNPFVRP